MIVLVDTLFDKVWGLVFELLERREVETCLLHADDEVSASQKNQDSFGVLPSNHNGYVVYETYLCITWASRPPSPSIWRTHLCQLSYGVLMFTLEVEFAITEPRHSMIGYSPRHILRAIFVNYTIFLASRCADGYIRGEVCDTSN